MDAKQVEQQYHALAAAGEHAQALELVTRHFELFPPHAQSVVYYWRLKMACGLGDVPLALDTLRRAVNDGHWYDSLAGNPDFEILAGSPEFQSLMEICADRRLQAIAASVPVLKILQPPKASGPYSLVFALHGNNSSAEVFAPRWEQARERGWLVALPQAPQSFGPGTYSWNDWDWAIPALVKQYGQILESYPVDPQKVVLAGFSMGAGLALWLAFERTLRCRGVLCVAPFLSEVDAFTPVLAEAESSSLRVYLVASPEDEYCHSVAVKLSSILPQYGVEHQLDIYTDTGHAFPASFEARLPAALDFILNER